MTDRAPLDLTDPAWRDDPQKLKEELLSRLSTGLVIDGAVQHPVDTLCAQLLLAARYAAEAQGKPFEIRAPSEVFLRGLDLLGLQSDILGKRATL